MAAPFSSPLYRSSCRVPGDLLNDGFHRVELLVVCDEGTIPHRHADVLTLHVETHVRQAVGWQGRWPGAERQLLPCTTELVEPGDPRSTAGDR